MNYFIITETFNIQFLKTNSRNFHLKKIQFSIKLLLKYLPNKESRNDISYYVIQWKHIEMDG